MNLSKQTTIHEVASWVKAKRSFMVCCHRSPDADALGSALGWTLGLMQLGKEVYLYVPDEIPDMLRFLPRLDLVNEKVPTAPRFDGTFIMDLAAASLVPEGLPEELETGPRIIVDHHAAHDDFGDAVLRDPNASATGELVSSLLQSLEIVPSRDTATCLYAALVADTGGFRYPSTQAFTLRLAADLLDCGVDPWEVAYALFEDWPVERFQLLHHVVSSLRLEAEGRLAVLHVTADDMDKIGAKEELVEGLVNYGRRLRGVEVAVLAWESRSRQSTSDKTPPVRVSIRSRGNVDVSTMAATLGGGGHRAAAGALLNLPMEQALARIGQVALEILDETAHPQRNAK